MLLAVVIEQPRYLHLFHQMHSFTLEDLEGDQFTYALLQLERTSVVHVSDVTDLCRAALAALCVRVGEEALVGLMPREEMKADLVALLKGEQLPSVKLEEAKSAKLQASKAQAGGLTLMAAGSGG